jgi:RNA polymerase sigma-70 factor, ECF subfamily
MSEVLTLMSSGPEATTASSSGRATEAALVAAAKNGDEHAFETLVRRHQRRILAVAVGYTRTRHDAEDVFQQTFQKAFVYLHKFEGKSSFSTWLTRIAINEALMFLRRKRGQREVSIDEDSIDVEGVASRPDIPDADPDPETSYLQQEQARLLSAALEKLRPGLRRAIELRELAELSTEETARRMGLSVAVVKGRLFQGRRKLHQALRRYMRPRRKPRNESVTIITDARGIEEDRLTSTACGWGRRGPSQLRV